MCSIEIVKIIWGKAEEITDPLQGPNFTGVRNLGCPQFPHSTEPRGVMESCRPQKLDWRSCSSAMRKQLTLRLFDTSCCVPRVHGLRIIWIGVNHFKAALLHSGGRTANQMSMKFSLLLTFWWNIQICTHPNYITYKIDNFLNKKQNVFVLWRQKSRKKSNPKQQRSDNRSPSSLPTIWLDYVHITYRVKTVILMFAQLWTFQISYPLPK